MGELTEIERVPGEVRIGDIVFWEQDGIPCIGLVDGTFRAKKGDPTGVDVVSLAFVSPVDDPPKNSKIGIYRVSAVRLTVIAKGFDDSFEFFTCNTYDNLCELEDCKHANKKLLDAAKLLRCKVADLEEQLMVANKTNRKLRRAGKIIPLQPRGGVLVSRVEPCLL